MKESSLVPKYISQNLRDSSTYKTFRDKIKNHTWFHYLFHCTFCFFKDNIFEEYITYTPKEWIMHHKEFK